MTRGIGMESRGRGLGESESGVRGEIIKAEGCVQCGRRGVGEVGLGWVS